MKPVAALGALPVTPSSTTKYGNLFAPNHNAFQKDQPPEFSVLTPSTARKPHDTSEDSDVTIADPNWSDTESDMETTPAMAAAEKKKPVQTQYNGPPAYLLDPNRTDPVALIAKTKHTATLDDLPMILDGITSSVRGNNSQANKVAPSSVPNSNHSDLSSFDGPSERKNTLPPLRIYTESRNRRPRNESLPTFGEQAGYNEERKERENRQTELERLRAERKKRDDQEMYEGLKEFEAKGGSQRGWNGEHESARQETLTAYHHEQDRKALEASEKEKAAAAPKVKTPNAGKQTAKSKSKRMNPEKVLAAQAKELEEAYSERYAKEVQAGQDYDDHNRLLAAKNHRDMMRAPWDHEEIKRKALEEQKARVLGEQSIKSWKKHGQMDKADERLRSHRIETLTTKPTGDSHNDFVPNPEKGYMKNGERLGAKSKAPNPKLGKGESNLELKEDAAEPKKDALKLKEVIAKSKDVATKSNEVVAKSITTLTEGVSKLEAALNSQDTDSKAKENKLKRKERDAVDQHGQREESMGMSEASEGPVKKAKTGKISKQEQRREAARGGKPKRQ
jgi:hypothetical protein